MFQGLDSHSVLHVLHHSTNLALLPEQEVVEMLRTRPVFNSTSCASQREKSSEDPEDSETSFNEGDEIQRDVALYHGFCALRGFMEAILCGRSDEEESGTDVAAKMQEAHDHLTSIFPLTFRVEVLENVFSLLFVSTEHLLDDVSQAAESDDLETLDSRSLRSSHTGSFESLVSIDSRNTSPWRPFRTSDPVSGPEPSGSCTASPESFKSLDVENFMESQTGCRATDRSSTNFVLEEQLIQEPDPYTEKMSAEDKTKQGIGSLRARELQFDDVGVKNMEGGVPREEFPPLVIGSGKGKLLELCERKVKGLLVNKTVVSQMLEVLKKCLNDVISLKSDQKECDEYKGK